MQNFVKKMITEKTELEGKIKRARAAIENPPFGSTKESIMLLGEQIKAMESYHYWLSERITYEEKR